MIRFDSDYTEGAHPLILGKLIETNLLQTVGYGEDEFCKEAQEYIKIAIGSQEAQVHFLVGGTQTNTTVIAAALRPHQGVISAETGHINIHETGAIEAINHKVLTLPSEDGKLTAQQVRNYVDEHYADESFEHIVQPKMVYISHPTELGTLYTEEELKNIHEVCEEKGLYLYLDGARLAYGLAADGATVTLPMLAKYCDVFYIGGTKVGALFGEAVVIMNPEIMQDFRYIIKQNGGMLAKGRLLGIQFLTMFKDNLYFRMGEHGILMANKLRKGLEDLGLSFLIDSPTNQIFPILSDEAIEALSAAYGFAYQKRIDSTHSAIRFCTSWVTQEEDIDALISSITSLVKE